jgi:hypothetical protein
MLLRGTGGFDYWSGDRGRCEGDGFVVRMVDEVPIGSCFFLVQIASKGDYYAFKVEEGVISSASSMKILGLTVGGVLRKAGVDWKAELQSPVRKKDAR